MVVSEIIAIGEIAVQLSPLILECMNLVAGLRVSGKEKKQVVTGMTKGLFEEYKRYHPGIANVSWEEIEPFVTRKDGEIENLYQKHINELKKNDG
jgi:hypothetical protein